jgi:methylthioribose-1-phosphate isomerase
MLEPPVRPIEWCDDHVRIIDQRVLPKVETHLDLTTPEQMADAIRGMALRGAPLIGIAAAMGVALEARRSAGEDLHGFRDRIAKAVALLRSTRPTASNLFWALDRMQAALEGGSPVESTVVLTDRLVAEALSIYEEDLEMGFTMGKIGVDLISQGDSILTHCNAGGLATSGFGTALAPVYVAARNGIDLRVFADETRPLLQGARLTAWELARSGIDVTVICDSAAHLLISRGRVDIVFVGADRITLSGDFANKVGTCGIAASANARGIPFYVVAPSSTIDFKMERGCDIPIEERDASEVTHVLGVRITPDGVSAYNPAFDVTPAELVSGFITEKGLIEPPFDQNIAAIGPGRPQIR